MQPAPFSDGPGLIRFLKGNMARRKDNLLVCEGPEGSGKSTTAGRICQALNPNFDVQHDTILNLPHFLDVLHELQPGRVYDLDEAINIFHNQDWATWQAKALSKIIRQMRIMRCTWILNVPDFDGLHPYLRDYRTRIRLYHQPVFDQDGMGNGPSKVLWRSEWFDYKEQRVRHRWTDVFDLHVETLDHDPHWRPYENKKIENFKGLVRAMKQRQNLEAAKQTKKMKNGKKRATAQPPSIPPP